MKKITTFIILCFLAFQSFAQIGQISDKLTPLGQWDDDTLPEHFFGTFNDIWGYAADDKEYIVMGSAAFVHFFDVTDPSNMIEIAKFEPGSSNTWRDFKSYENYIYAVMDGSSEGLLVFDMSGAPDNIELVTQDQSVFTSAHNCYIDEANGRLYMCSTNIATDLVVYDLTNDPANPQHITNLSLPGGGIHDLYVRDNIAYASSENDGYYIYDLTDLENPITIASIVTQNYNHSSWVTEDGSFAIYAEEVPSGLPLGVIDLRDMMIDDLKITTLFQETIIEVAESAPKPTPHNPFILGDMAFVSYYEDGVHIYDISDPTQPTLYAYFDTYGQNVVYNTDFESYAGCWGVYPYLPSGNIFASDMSNGLISFRIKDTSPTKEVASFANDIQIFPNPVVKDLSIEVKTNERFNYQLSNAIGQEWKNGNLVPGNNTIEMTALPTGVYFLSISSENEIYTQKVVKE